MKEHKFESFETCLQIIGAWFKSVEDLKAKLKENFKGEDLMLFAEYYMPVYRDPNYKRVLHKILIPKGILAAL